MVPVERVQSGGVVRAAEMAGVPRLVRLLETTLVVSSLMSHMKLGILRETPG